MKNAHTIFETDSGKYRILEVLDPDVDLDNLKGDIFNPDHMEEMHGKGMSLEKLREEELDFEAEVNREGVFGYVLEVWDPSPGCGWTHVDSCWGFVGQWDPKSDRYNHYIVEELKNQIPKGEL